MRSTLSGFIPRIALAAAIALAVAACASNDNDEEQRAAETATPVPQLDIPVPTANETVPGGIETAARQLLADDLEVDEGDFRLDSSEGKGWSDASLGCPQEGMAYAQVITPGYKLVFDLAGKSYAVHTNSDGSHMVICGDGQ